MVKYIQYQIQTSPLKVTLISCPEGVTVRGEDCIGPVFLSDKGRAEAV